jgi:sec-independent protein translocase protein TatC
MAVLDFFNKRRKDPNVEMSFIDHLEELRWHLIRSVIAIGVAAIIFFIYVREIVHSILLAPTQDEFITYGWLCNASHALGLGDAVCMDGVNASFLSTQMTGQFISSFTISFVGGFIVAFPYIIWEFWNSGGLLSPHFRRRKREIRWE